MLLTNHELALIRGELLSVLEDVLTAPLTDIQSALAAIQAAEQQHLANDAANRAAFDSLAGVVKAFIGTLTTGGNLSADQQAQAQAILDSITSADATVKQQATDEAALQAEVPAAPAPPAA